MKDEYLDRIREILDNWKEGWRNKDPELASRDYSDDADWTNAFGMDCKGRDEINAVLSHAFSLPHVMTARGESLEDTIRLVRDDVALVWSQVERTGQTTPSGAPLGVRHTTHLRVLTSGPDGWKIVSHLISDARDRESPSH